MSLTLIIIILTCIISYLCLNDRTKFNALLHSPYQEHQTKEYHRLLTSGFVHGSMTHLLVNMYVLYIFGEAVENQFLYTLGEGVGRLAFLGIYLITIVLANVPTFLKQKNNAHFSSVGASGAVSGILFIFILYYPWSQLLLFFVIPCPAIIAGVLYLVYSSWASKNSNDRIDHSAHFAGAISGMALALMVKPSLFSHFLNALTTQSPF